MLSIIIITKNEERFLPNILDSINRQDFTEHYEIIVADAYSTDNTRIIARDNGAIIVDGGFPGIGRNSGGHASKGDLLLFLDADVALPREFLRKNIEEFKRRNLDVASVVAKPMSKRRIDYFLYEIANIALIASQFFSPHGAGHCILCKKEVFVSLKGFNTYLRFSEDHEFFQRAKKAGYKTGILKTIPLLSNIRRLKMEGRIRLSVKYTLFFIRSLTERKDSIPIKYNINYSKH